MSSIADRITTLFRIKANKALDEAEDPREVLDYSYTQQLELLQKVRRGVTDVASSRKRLEMQLYELQQSADRLQDLWGSKTGSAAVTCGSTLSFRIR